MSVPDHRDPFAKRKGCGFGRSVRRHGFSDGFWPAWVGDAAFEGDDDFDRGVHVDVHLAINIGDEGRGREQYGAGTSYDEEFSAGEYGTGNAWSGSSSGACKRGSGCSSGSASGSGGSGEEVIITAPIPAEVAELADALA